MPAGRGEGILGLGGDLDFPVRPADDPVDNEVITFDAADSRYGPEPGGGAHPDLAAHDALGLQTDAEATTHAGAADPHPVYQKESEKGTVSGYASLDAGTKVPTVELGGAGAQTLDVLRGNQTWTPVPGLRIKSIDAANVSITATGDNQASVTAGSDITGVTFVFVQWLVEAAQAANAQFIVEGEIHQPDHTVLETFRYRFDATGAGDIAQVAAGLFAVASPATGVYHLNMTTVTLGGGTFTVKQRLLLFNF